jgi:hypothetical protein
MVTRTWDHFGQIGIVLNNAGNFQVLSRLWETDPDIRWRDVGVNLRGRRLSREWRWNIRGILRTAYSDGKRSGSVVWLTDLLWQQDATHKVRGSSRKTKSLAFEARFEADRIRRLAERAEEQFIRRSGILDDTLPHAAGPGGLAVTGWIFGAGVETVAGIPWVEPVLDRVEDWRKIDFSAVRERFDRILACYRILV